MYTELNDQNTGSTFVFCDFHEPLNSRLIRQKYSEYAPLHLKYEKFQSNSNQVDIHHEMKRQREVSILCSK